MPADKPKPDLSEFFKLSKPKRKPCAVGFAVEQLKPAERTQLAAAFEVGSGYITNAAISEWLAKRDQQANVSAIVSHRKGTCSCNDDA